MVHSYFSPFRGGETIAYNTFKMLQADGHEVVYMAADRKPYFEEHYEYQKYFIKDITSIKAYLKRPWAYYYNFEAKKKLNLLINDFKPDLIHLHNIMTCFSPAVLECCKNIPTIMTVHDASIVCPASTLMYKNKYYCNEQSCKNGKNINCLLNLCDSNNVEASLRKTIRSYVLNKNIQYIDKFITPSNALKKVLVKANIDPNKIITINNFLPREEFNTIPNYANKGYFLFIGSLSQEKGVHYLLEAIKDLPNEIKLKIVGSGKEENNLKQYAKENNLDNVEFVGFKNKEEIKEYYQNCIATILPCNWFEIFGMTNIESFINGKPVIASNIGGIPEIVEHNVNGLLFEPTNIEQLKEHILTYWNNSDLVIEHGKEGYDKVINCYTDKIYYKSLLTLYKEEISATK